MWMTKFLLQCGLYELSTAVGIIDEVTNFNIFCPSTVPKNYHEKKFRMRTDTYDPSKEVCTL